MRLMWERFGRPTRRYAIRRPYTVADLERTLGEYAGDAAFARDFFSRYVRGRDVPDFAALLGQAGMRVAPAQPGAAYAGPLALTADSMGITVTSPAIAGTPLHAAGLERGDRLVSADGRAVRGDEEWQALLSARAPGDSVPLIFQQRGREVRAVLRLTADPRVAVVPMEHAGEDPSEGQRAFRAAWLASRAAR
jgi:predicted metalloprotease with PDZ domain